MGPLVPGCRQRERFGCRSVNLTVLLWQVKKIDRDVKFYQARAGEALAERDSMQLEVVNNNNRVYVNRVKATLVAGVWQ